jgi:hypothetical protein
MFIVRLPGGLFKIEDEAYSALEFFCFMTTHSRTLLLEQSQWELAPSDFLFLHLKRFLVAERFSRYDEVKTAVQHWVKTAADFFDEGIQKLVPRYDKCLNLGGDYVEK